MECYPDDTRTVTDGARKIVAEIIASVLIAIPSTNPVPYVVDYKGPESL